MNVAFNAVRKADLEALKSLLQSDDKDHLFSVVDWEGNNVLHEAVIADNVECVHVLVAAFPTMAEQVNYKKRTPLHLACNLKANLDIIKILCEFKNTLSMENKHGQTVLFEALIMKRVWKKIDDGYILELIKILIENGADINARGVCGFTMLHEAIFSNKFEEFKLLLSYGLKMNTPDDFGRTVLCIATMAERCEFLKFIVENEPSLVNVLNEDLSSALLNASDSACENCIELLIQNNADVLQVNRAGESCIELAIMSGKGKNVAKLLEYGADPTVYSKNNCWHSHPLQRACETNNAEIVELLLNHESINSYVIEEKHPLVFGVKNANPKILQLMLNHRPFLDKSLTIEFPQKAKNKCSGVIGYMLFVSFQRIRLSVEYYDQILQCCEMLLKENFPVNHSNGVLSALTSLLLPFCSSQMHHNILNIVKILVEYGCNVYEMCFSNEICEQYGIDVEIRNALQVPDALVAAFMSKNVPATKYLLRYWPQPPILLLLLTPHKSPIELLDWCEILIEFGWPTGNTYAKQLEELIHKKERLNSKNRKALIEIQNPCSLNCLAKFAVRNYLFEKKSEFDMTLPELVHSLYLPASLRDELLFDGHKNDTNVTESSLDESDDDSFDAVSGLFD